MQAITEETTAAGGDKSCADLGHTCCQAGAAETTESADAKTSAPPGTAYADPGYLADKKKRYPLNGEKRIRAAWSYISQKDNAAQYTPAQLKRIKAKIRGAMKGIGATVTTEGWVVWPASQITESEIQEWYGGYGSPETAGSWSVCASNGPVSMSLSSYGMDPADLDLVLRAAADAACLALAALDPDMDGDVDVPGTSGDTDGDAGESAPAESAEPDPADMADNEPPAPEAAAGDTKETEDPAMGDTQTAAGTTAAPTFSQADIDAAAQRGAEAALAADRAARAARKAGKRTGQTESAPTGSVTESGGKTVTETEDEKIARLTKAALAEQFPQETDDERIGRKVRENVQAHAATLIQSGQINPGRKGIVQTAEQAAANAAGGGAADVINESTGMPASWGAKKLQEMSHEELVEHTTPVLGAHIFGDRSNKFG